MVRWQLSASTVTIVPFSDNIFSNFGTAVISLDFASVAICASTMRCSQPHALTMCSADLPLARSNERRKHLAVNRDHALAGLGKRRHEPLKRGPELIGIELAEQPAERVVTGWTVLHVEKFAEKWLLCPGEQRHVHRALSAAQDRAQSDHQQGVEIVQGGVAAPGVFQVFEAGSEPIQRDLPGAFDTTMG